MPFYCEECDTELVFTDNVWYCPTCDEIMDEILDEFGNLVWSGFWSVREMVNEKRCENCKHYQRKPPSGITGECRDRREGRKTIRVDYHDFCEDWGPKGRERK